MKHNPINHIWSAEVPTVEECRKLYELGIVTEERYSRLPAWPWMYFAIRKHLQ
jgi:hypothetical protein